MVITDCRTTSAIRNGANTGKIFVMPVEQAIRIRTGEAGPDAL